MKSGGLWVMSLESHGLTVNTIRCSSEEDIIKRQGFFQWWCHMVRHFNVDSLESLSESFMVHSRLDRRNSWKAIFSLDH